MSAIVFLTLLVSIGLRLIATSLRCYAEKANEQ